MVFDYNTVGTINISFFNANTVVANVVGRPEAKVSVDGNIISVSKKGDLTLSKKGNTKITFKHVDTNKKKTITFVVS